MALTVVTDEVRIAGGLLPGLIGLIGHLNHVQPLDVGLALPARQQQAHRVALLRAQGFAVLTIGDQGIVPGFLEGNAAVHAGGVCPFGDEPSGPRLQAHFAKQGRERHPRPLRATHLAVGLLHILQRGLAPFSPGVARAFQKMDTVDRREAHEIRRR